MLVISIIKANSIIGQYIQHIKYCIKLRQINTIISQSNKWNHHHLLNQHTIQTIYLNVNIHTLTLDNINTHIMLISPKNNTTQIYY